MFTIDATVDITVISFDIVGKKDGNGEVMVYTRVGDFQGHEEDESGWELIFNKAVQVEKRVRSSLGLLDRDVHINEGMTQSFFVWAKKGLLYTEGDANRRGLPYDSDASLVINEGIATKKLFQKITGNGQFSGGIR